MMARCEHLAEGLLVSRTARSALHVRGYWCCGKRDGAALGWGEQGLSIEDVAEAGVYAMRRGGLRVAPDPRDISECEGLLEVYFKQVLPLADTTDPGLTSRIWKVK